MFQSVIVMLERATSVIWRVNENTFHLPGKPLFQSLQTKKVVTKNKLVVKNIIVRRALLGMERVRRILKQDARLQARPLVFPDPRKLQSRLLRHCTTSQCSVRSGVTVG